MNRGTAGRLSRRTLLFTVSLRAGRPAIYGLLVVLSLLGAEAAEAKCTVSVSASADGTAITGTATSSGGCGGSTINVYLDGFGALLLAQQSCNTPSCTVSFTYTGCVTPGTHNIDAHGSCHAPGADNSCGPDEGTHTTTQVTVPKPQIGVSHEKLDEMGNGVVHVPYQFANSGSLRELAITLDGGIVAWTNPATQSGVWTTELDTTCWGPETRTLGAEARQCGDEPTKSFAKTALAVSSKPDVSVSYSPPAEAGTALVTVGYSFPNTAAAGQRSLTLEYANGSLIATHAPLDVSGTWTTNLDTSCLTGDHTLIAKAMACQTATPPFQHQAQTTFSADSLPTVQLSLQKGPIENGKRTVKAHVAYDMGEGTGWRIRVYLLRWFTADGKAHEGSLQHDFDPGQRMGVENLTISAPHEARQVVVLATATSCKGTGTAEREINCGCDGTGDPVYFADGNVRVTDVDPLPPIAGQRLVRTYDSDEQVVPLFGRGWTTLFESRIVVNADRNEQLVSVVTPANAVVTFRGSGSSFRQTSPTAAGPLGRLFVDAAAGTYGYRAAGSSELAVFRMSDGRLIALRDVTTGREAQLSYDTDGLPYSLSDSWSGTAWHVTIDKALRRVQSISVDGDASMVWSYVYDPAGNLVTVTAPGNATWRTYEYIANRMTASRDGMGNLIESHTYDANGYGISSTGPSDEISTIEYNLPGTTANETMTRVTYKTGATAEYRLRPSGGAPRVSSVTGGCGTCGASEATYARDDRGRIIREQDARGYITLHAWDPVTHNRVSTTTFLQPFSCDPATDPARCRLTPEALAEVGVIATRSTLTTTYEYGDAQWPERPTVVRTESLVAVLSRRGGVGVLSGDDDQRSRRETFTYDAATGNVLTRAVSGWTAGQYLTRTSTTTLYDGAEGAAFDPGGPFLSSWLPLAQPAGFTKAIDGPRSDVTDVTMLVDYPVDASVPALLRGRLAATRNAAGHVVRYEGYDRFGNVTRTVDPNGAATESTYDTLGRLTASTLKGTPGCDTAADALCATDLIQTLSYHGAGPMQSQTRAGGGFTTYAYDGRGRMELISRGPSATDLRERIEYSYDPATGRKSLERILSFDTVSGTWVEKRREAFAYDARGLLKRVTHGDGTFIEYGYDSAQQVVSVRDENHADPAVAPNTRYAYSPAGRLERVTQDLATAPDGTGMVVTTYAYDARGNLSGVVDPNGNGTSYLYDDFDQVVQTISPVTGTTTYAYDAAGQLMSTTDANEASTARTYDALGRVLTATSTRPGAAAETVTWTYDASDAGRFAVARLSAMSDPAGSTAYFYDRRGLLREATRSFPGAAYSYTTGFAYDRDGNRTAVVYPSTQLTVNYTFDYAGRPKSAGGFVTAADYLPFGPMTRMQLANGTTQSFAYDSRYRIEKNELVIDGAPPSTPPMVKYTYGYDAAGNVTSILDALDNDYHRHFEYDELHRLVKANTGRALWGKGTYVWDAMGNMVSYELGRVTDSGPEPLLSRARPKPPNTKSTVPRGRTGSFAYAGTTPLLESVTTNDVPRTVSYDAAGNEVSFFATRTYSPRNLMQKVADLAEAEDVPHTLTYTYDGRGIRSIRAESPSDGPGTAARRYYLYAPELRLLAETRDDSPNFWNLSNVVFDKDVKYEIVWFGDRPVAQVAPGGPALFTFADHLGTPILQTDSTANVVWRVEYEPFGNIYEMREGTRTTQPLRFPGQEMAMTWEGPEENYNIFRWYRAGWGRYSQADPIGALRKRGSMFESNHLYAYVDGNPLRFTDRLGLVKWDCGFVIGTGNSPVGLGGGGMMASCTSECKNGKSVFVQLASGMLGLSAGPLLGGLSAFSSQLEDGTDTPDAQNLVGVVIYGSVGAWIPFGGGCGNVVLGKAKGNFSCSMTWFGGFDIGLDVYGGYSAIVLGPYEKCCK